jgi:hypothetical protein
VQALKTQLEERDAALERLREDVQQLNRCVDALRTAVDEVAHSRRWRLAESVGQALGQLRASGEAANPWQRARDTLEALDTWRQSRR